MGCRFEKALQKAGTHTSSFLACRLIFFHSHNTNQGHKPGEISMGIPAPEIRTPEIHLSTTYQILAVDRDRNCPGGPGARVNAYWERSPRSPPGRIPPQPAARESDLYRSHRNPPAAPRSPIRQSPYIRPTQINPISDRLQPPIGSVLPGGEIHRGCAFR